MQRILVVRLSALGDVIHGMPAITDIHRRWPHAIIDIAVDERFADIPRQHVHIRRVISLPLKRLKRNALRSGTFAELRALIRDLRTDEYDVVIDLHGLWKSALVTRLARAKLRVGFHVSQCAERPAARFYHRHFQPAHSPSRVQWLRDLAAFAVGSDSSPPADYGLRRAVPVSGELRRSVVFFHSVSRADRRWPDADWIGLGRALVVSGYRIELPWGSAEEKQRSEALAAAIGADSCIIPPLLSMVEWVERLAGMAFAVGVDSGLTHLAAATGTPCIAIFTASCPWLLVPQEPERSLALGKAGCPPSLSEVEKACLTLAARLVAESSSPAPLAPAWNRYEQKLALAFCLLSGSGWLRQLLVNQL